MRILEHIHVNVDSIEATESFLRAALPEIVRRGGGHADEYGEWVHLGTAREYIALTEVQGTQIPAELRHIGLVVDDVESLMTRLERAGFQPSDSSALDSNPYRRRVYYIDDNGLPWEFVQYLSEDATLRNDYSH